MCFTRQSNLIDVLGSASLIPLCHSTKNKTAQPPWQSPRAPSREGGSIRSRAGDLCCQSRYADFLLCKMFVLGVSGVLPVSDDSGSSMKCRCRMSKPIKIQKFSRCDKYWGDDATVKRGLRPYGVVRAARTRSPHTNSYLGRCNSICVARNIRWFRGDCFQPCGCSISTTRRLATASNPQLQHKSQQVW